MLSHQIKQLDRRVQSHALRAPHWRRVVLRTTIGLGILSAVAWIAMHAESELKTMETWIAGHGALGMVAFVVLMVVLTSLFVPDTMLAIAAGALYGVTWGALLTIIGAILTAAVNFWAACNFFRPWIDRILEKHPKLQAIRSAANQEGLRLQLLLRLSPINPVSVNYVLGASGVRFVPFLIATLGLIPGLFAEVYFGYVAKHISHVSSGLSDHTRLQTAITIAGLVLCVLVTIVVSRIAAKALAEATTEPTIVTSAGNP